MARTIPSLSLPSSLMSRSHKHGRRSLAIRRVNIVFVRILFSFLALSLFICLHWPSRIRVMGGQLVETLAWQYDISTLINETYFHVNFSSVLYTCMIRTVKNQFASKYRVKRHEAKSRNKKVLCIYHCQKKLEANDEKDYFRIEKRRKRNLHPQERQNRMHLQLSKSFSPITFPSRDKKEEKTIRLHLYFHLRMHIVLRILSHRNRLHNVCNILRKSRL